MQEYSQMQEKSQNTQRKSHPLRSLYSYKVKYSIFADKITLKTSEMKTEMYQTPAVQTLEMQLGGILCASDIANIETGASWGLEDGSDINFIL